jgi:hypothetical protein
MHFAVMPVFPPPRPRLPLLDGPLLPRLILLRLLLFRPFATGLIVLISIILLVGAAAQPSASRQIGASRFALAAVTDGRGRPVVDVGADDFMIEEAGQAREILSVRVADYPVVVVVDNGTAGRSDFLWIQKAVTRLLERLGPRPVGLVTIGGPPKLVASFEDDRAVVLERLASIEAAAASDSRPLAGAVLAAETIRASGAFFSAILVIAASPIESSNHADQEVAAPLIDSGAVMHVVLNQTSIGASDARLRTLARQTHGEFTPIYTSGSYQPAVDRLADRLTTEMLVEYLVPVGSRPLDVKIGVRLPGARVRGLGVAPQ